MGKETANWDLEKLIVTRSFEELSVTQKDWVLQQLSAEEYQQQRLVLLASKDFFEEDKVPAPPTLEAILKARKIPTAPNKFFSFLTQLKSWNVPAWQLGMAICCAWFLGYWNAPEKGTGQLLPEIVYHTDTLIKEIPIYIGLGKQRYAAYVDSQDHKIINTSPIPAHHRVYADSNTTSIVRDRDLLKLTVGMQ